MTAILYLVLASVATPREITDRIDPYIQKSFANVMTEKFGMSRMPRVGPHITFPAWGPTRLMPEESERYRVTLSVIGNKTSRLTASTAKLRPAGELAPANIQRARETGGRLPALPDGKAVLDLVRKDLTGKRSYKLHDYILETRPIFGRSDKCFSCHRESKRSEPLGVLVYAFQPIKRGP